MSWIADKRVACVADFHTMVALCAATAKLCDSCGPKPMAEPPPPHDVRVRALGFVRPVAPLAASLDSRSHPGLAPRAKRVLTLAPKLPKISPARFAAKLEILAKRQVSWHWCTAVKL